MQYFSNNNNKFSKICLGTWSLSGKKSNIKSYEKLNEKKIYSILEKALENLIDIEDKKVSFAGHINVHLVPNNQFCDHFLT